jgi:LysM repeat protein
MPEQPLVASPVAETAFAKPRVVYTEKEIQRSFVKHTVDFGQTLFAISRQYEVPVDSIKHWNNFEENSLRQGQVLLIRKPDGAKTAVKSVPATTPAPALQLPAGRVYTVKAGDTLFKISKELGVTVQQLRDWNQKASDQVAVGEQLKVQ